jgi:hypothetical protein
MAQHFVWEEAHVSDGTLTIPLAPPGPQDPNMWNGIFRDVADGKMVGVDDAGSRRWGEIHALSPDRIIVEGVSASLVNDLKRHLDAAVDATNVEYERMRREQQDRAAADARLTDLFRRSSS